MGKFRKKKFEVDEGICDEHNAPARGPHRLRTTKNKINVVCPNCGVEQELEFRGKTEARITCWGCEKDFVAKSDDLIGGVTL